MYFAQCTSSDKSSAHTGFDRRGRSRIIREQRMHTAALERERLLGWRNLLNRHVFFRIETVFCAKMTLSHAL